MVERRTVNNSTTICKIFGFSNTRAPRLWNFHLLGDRQSRIDASGPATFTEFKIPPRFHDVIARLQARRRTKRITFIHQYVTHLRRATVGVLFPARFGTLPPAHIAVINDFVRTPGSVVTNDCESHSPSIARIGFVRLNTAWHFRCNLCVRMQLRHEQPNHHGDDCTNESGCRSSTRPPGA